LTLYVRKKSLVQAKNIHSAKSAHKVVLWECAILVVYFRLLMNKTMSLSIPLKNHMNLAHEMCTLTCYKHIYCSVTVKKPTILHS
jgi:hypothetical protein